jgi:hypothetical protein
MKTCPLVLIQEPKAIVTGGGGEQAQQEAFKSFRKTHSNPTLVEGTEKNTQQSIFNVLKEDSCPLPCSELHAKLILLISSY